MQRIEFVDIESFECRIFANNCFNKDSLSIFSKHFEF